MENIRKTIRQLKIIRKKILELETYLETKIIESKIPKDLDKRLTRLPFKIYKKIKSLREDLGKSRADRERGWVD